jgi:hypothetical protein
MSYSTTQCTLLCPRPLARYAGRFLLVSLLPPRQPFKHLPGEIWTKVFEYVISEELEGKHGRSCFSGLTRLLLISKEFKVSTSRIYRCRKLLNIWLDKDIILPVFYSQIAITSLSSLRKFIAHLTASDKAWDSIRRIPYSSPGRWVHSLDLSYLCLDTSEIEDSMFCIDLLLTRVWPLVPFLTRCVLNPAISLSRRAMNALHLRDGASHLTVLKGIKITETNVSISTLQSDSLVQLLRYCPGLEELEAVGPGLDTSDFDFLLPSSEIFSASDDIPFHPLSLPALRTLAVLSTHSGPLLYSLLHTPLPALRTVTLTPYHEVASSIVTPFIATHGMTLHSLLLYTPKVWPTSLCTSPSDLLVTCPSLRHLSLEAPTPDLAIPSSHPLQVLSLPRPNGVLLAKLESTLGNFPDLRAVRARDVKWLRKGMALRAQEAGVQGQMRDWRRRLARKGVRMLDAVWSDGM